MQLSQAVKIVLKCISYLTIKDKVHTDRADFLQIVKCACASGSQRRAQLQVERRV